MANSIITYTGDGSTTQYALNFTLGTLSRDYVKCRVGSEVDGLGDPVYRTLEWVNEGLVNIQGSVPANGIAIVFTRTVPKDKLVHDYTDGAAIIEKNLDESNLQNLMAIHEFLDGRLEGAFAQNISMSGFRITDLGDGIDTTDAVNYGQLVDMTGNAPAYAAAAQAAAVTAAAENDAAAVERVLAQAAAATATAAASGMRWKPPVRFATTANDTLSGLAARDGVTPIAGDRALVFNQSTTSQNGIYIAASGAWTRATDADSWAELPSAAVIVEEGTVNKDKIFVCTSNAGGTLGSTAVVWADYTPVSIAAASQAEAEAGVENTKYLTSLRTKQSININTPVIRQIPQVSQSGAYTLVLADQNKHVFHPSADTTARIWTIPANASVAFPIGTAVTFVNQNGAGVITIAITTDTLRLAGTGVTGSRTLAANGIATALKVTATEWLISGVGLT